MISINDTILMMWSRGKYIWHHIHKQKVLYQEVAINIVFSVLFLFYLYSVIWSSTFILGGKILLLAWSTFISLEWIYLCLQRSVDTQRAITEQRQLDALLERTMGVIMTQSHRVNSTKELHPLSQAIHELESHELKEKQYDIEFEQQQESAAEPPNVLRRVLDAIIENENLHKRNDDPPIV